MSLRRVLVLEMGQVQFPPLTEVLTEELFATSTCNGPVWVLFSAEKYRDEVAHYVSRSSFTRVGSVTNAVT